MLIALVVILIWTTHGGVAAMLVLDHVDRLSTKQARVLAVVCGPVSWLYIGTALVIHYYRSR